MKAALVLVLLLSIRSAAAFVPSSSSARPQAGTSLNAQADRRNFLDLIVAASAAAITSIAATPPALAAAALPVTPNPPYDKDLNWPLGKVAFSLLPLAGTSTRRATVKEEIVKGQIWTFDQLQGIVNVNVPVRQTVIKLSEQAGGGLFVYNPIAPTPQLLKMMTVLQQEHGPIRHIVLGSVALEHKATFGPFAQRFPNATVWIQPGQWAFPLDLNVQALGVTQRGSNLREIPVPGKAITSKIYYNKDDNEPEWATDFGYETLGPLKFKSVGGFSETAFYHRSTKSLIVTDTVISVTDTPPPIIAEDPRGMLFHARDAYDEVIKDTPANRQRGWRRMVQFGLVFFPSEIDVVPFGQAVSESRKMPRSMRNLGDGAVPFDLYPWTWHAGNVDDRNFQAISNHGKLFCPPILTKLILDREPARTIAWVDRVCERFDDFERVIPSHLNNNISAGPKEFSAAFDPLRSSPANKVYPQRPLAQDLALLQKASDLLTNVGVVGPSQVCDGEEARLRGRFASTR